MERKRRLIGEHRATVDLAARYRVAAAAPGLDARITQISATGLRLRTVHELAVGARITVMFDAAGSPAYARARSGVRAEVVRALPGYKPEFEYGLRLVDDGR